MCMQRAPGPRALVRRGLLVVALRAHPCRSERGDEPSNAPSKDVAHLHPVLACDGECVSPGVESHKGPTGPLQLQVLSLRRSKKCFASMSQLWQPGAKPNPFVKSVLGPLEMVAGTQTPGLTGPAQLRITKIFAHKKASNKKQQVQRNEGELKVPESGQGQGVQHSTIHAQP